MRAQEAESEMSAREPAQLSRVRRRSSSSGCRDKLGGRFKAGVLLYTGGSTVPFGDGLAAVPLRGLWVEAP